MNHDCAVRLTEAGLHIFQACAETKRPLYTLRSASKSARVANVRWSVRPDALPAINVGVCGLMVIDLDVGHAEGVNGLDAFGDLVSRYGFPDNVPAVSTPRGGRHLYLRQPAEPYLSNATDGLPPGIDIRADPRNAYVIAPGAVMADGQFYEAIEGTPDLCEAFAAGTIPECPAWIVDIIDAAVAAKVEQAAKQAPQWAAHVDVSDKRARAYGLAALEGEADKLARAGVGGRNHALNRAAFTLAGKSVSCFLPVDEVRNTLWAACVTNGYVTSRAVGDGPRQFHRTFNSGWRDGMGKPLQGPRDAETTGIIINLKPK